MNKAAQVIKNLSQGFLISGILSALMGAYYLFAKAGLPLQDPPLALKIQYEIDFGVGEKMLMLGLTSCLSAALAIPLRGFAPRQRKFKSQVSIRRADLLALTRQTEAR